MSASQAFSAPGKVLLAGGYLVLFPEYQALSVGVSARMHAVASKSDISSLKFSSPQFASTWEYSRKPGSTELSSSSNVGKNPFLEAVVEVVAAYYGQPLPKGEVTIYSDSGFHSQSGSFSGELKQFKYHGIDITKVAKTGLGSSAALCVVATAGLIALYTNEPIRLDEAGLRLVHNLAQTAHCWAQGKVGSGFDVATAVYGSIKYSRFPPKSVPSDASAITSDIANPWPMTAEPIHFPDNITLVLGDVQGGSETPGMVRKVLSWKEGRAETANRVWSSLNKANLSLIEALKAQAVDLGEVKNAMAKVRAGLREMTVESGVDIEPEIQTNLLDSAVKINGVLGGVVPGAGGYDANCLLVESSLCAQALQLLASSPEFEAVVFRPFGVESQGLQLENISNYVA